MALTAPYKQQNYMGEFASSSACLTDIQARKWDSTGDGLGDPQNGMFYFNTTSGKFEYYYGEWIEIATSSGFTGVQLYYVGKHGNDSNDGRSLTTAFLTIIAAVNAINAMGDAADDNRYLIYVVDGGDYTESTHITIPAYTRLYAPGATIRNKTLQFINNGAEAYIHTIAVTTSYTDCVSFGQAYDYYLKVDHLYIETDRRALYITSYARAHVDIGEIYHPNGTGANTKAIHVLQGELTGYINRLKNTKNGDIAIYVGYSSAYIDLIFDYIETSPSSTSCMFYSDSSYARVNLIVNKSAKGSIATSNTSTSSSSRLNFIFNEFWGSVYINEDYEVSISYNRASFSNPYGGNGCVETGSDAGDAVINLVGNYSNYTTDNLTGFYIPYGICNVQMNLWELRSGGTTPWNIGTNGTLSGNIAKVINYTSTKPPTSTGLVDVNVCRYGDGGASNVNALSNGEIEILSDGSPFDALDCWGIKSIIANTANNNVAIGGFVNGIRGQVIHVNKFDASYSLVIEHNEGTGNQDIFVEDSVDKTISDYGVATLICNGTLWVCS